MLENIENLATDATNVPGVSLGSIAGIGGLVAAGGALSLLTKIHQGHVAFREHSGVALKEKDSRLPWGKNAGELYKLKRPGWRLKVPFAHAFDHQISTQNHTTEEFVTQRNTAAGRQYEVRSSFTWGLLPERDEDGQKIEHPIPWEWYVYRAGYRAASQEDMLRDVVGTFATAIWTAIPPKIEDPEQLNLEELQTAVANHCAKPLLHYGLGLRHYNFLGAAYTPPDVQGYAQGVALGGFLTEKFAELDGAALFDFSRRAPGQPAVNS